MQKPFRKDNTQGYTSEQMDELNSEWEQRSRDLDPDSDQYDQEEKDFCDEVNHREQ